MWPALLVWMAVGGEAAPETPLQRRAYVERHMGFEVSLVFYESDAASANRAAQAVFARFAALDAVMSDYKPDSELMRLCKEAAPGKPHPVGPDLLAVLAFAQSVSDDSDGAFDVTVGPLTQLWRRSKRQRALPTPARLAEARSRVGWKSLVIDREAGTAELKMPEMRLDLGGIAAGYALDESAKVLTDRKITRFLIDASGDVRVGDPPPGAKAWRLGVVPLEADGPPSLHLGLSNMAASTSGDAYQFVEIEGKRYSHLVDSRTGLGMTRRAAATVVAPAGIAADSLATALCLLGPEKGFPLIEKIPGAAAILLQVEDGKPTSHVSRRWNGYLVEPGKDFPDAAVPAPRSAAPPVAAPSPGSAPPLESSRK